MRVEINTGKMREFGEVLVSVSKTSTNLGWELDGVCRQMRQLSQMEECRRVLNVQKEALDLIAVRLAAMGDSLARISETYSLAEARNSDRLEECAPVQTVKNTTVYSVQQEFKGRIDRILYQ